VKRSAEHCAHVRQKNNALARAVIQLGSNNDRHFVAPNNMTISLAATNQEKEDRDSDLPVNKLAFFHCQCRFAPNSSVADFSAQVQAGRMSELGSFASDLIERR
jgi:hypothetical protein